MLFIFCDIGPIAIGFTMSLGQIKPFTLLSRKLLKLKFDWLMTFEH